MAERKIKQKTDTSTEEKIKNAARIVFHNKGFAATRTREIAEEAGINLALLNYYFRSKEKLFDIIMLESMKNFFKSISEVFNNEQTTLGNKIEQLAIRYIDLLVANPNIPLFLMSELKTQPDELVARMGMKEIIMKSSFLKQFEQGVKDGKIVPIHPLHFMMNLISMTVFPFVASPMIKGLGDLSQNQFNELMEQRKLLIPKWVKATLKAK
ncbi:MAG: Transcriptional regulator, AcrR family [uncultured Segetibacter sp.]|uniref:Transcriptional regulator, AcrR family n=1 Tax=uncultured Segetibacter sp. TaxID=481133 RepID=A0A6J4SIR1_9BACT|nr:MAG: Transcriptional regulator, AcrR family [uncultured Segetibacter sp.]